LRVDKTGAKRWTFMYEQDGRQREAGLGGVNSVPLAKARVLAAEFREAIAAGRDPVAERKAARQAQRSRKTFGQCESLARRLATIGQWPLATFRRS
jgi:Arm DNA-binding domain